VVDDLPAPLTRLSTTGLLRDEPPRTIERWVDAACSAGLIRVSSDRYRTLSLTPLGRDVMAGRVEEVVLATPVLRPPSPRRVRRRSPPGAGDVLQLLLARARSPSCTLTCTPHGSVYSRGCAGGDRRKVATD
jgi:hypothetical protein